MRLYIYVSIISVPRETRPLRRAAQSIYRTYEENNQVRSLNISLFFFFSFPPYESRFLSLLWFFENDTSCVPRIFSRSRARDCFAARGKIREIITRCTVLEEERNVIRTLKRGCSIRSTQRGSFTERPLLIVETRAYLVPRIFAFASRFIARNSSKIGV